MTPPGLHDLERRWDDGARRDAMYVILSQADKKGGRWDADAFFASGRAEIGSVLAYVDSLEVALGRSRALDFGCGIGRLTQALAEHFERVDGVDVSAAMVEQARALNRFGARCAYHHNAAPALALFPDDAFDFVYSNIVLQHMEPGLGRGYIAEFVRVLAPGGLALFQVPSGPAVATPSGTARARRPLRRSAIAAASAATPGAIRATAGSAVAVEVRVRNVSKRTWPALGRPDGTGQVRLGNHWLGPGGAVLLLDDLRADLPADLAPGEEVTIPLLVTMPNRGGEYVLELDLVEEHVGWFGPRGSATARVPVTVLGEIGDADAPFSVWQPDCLDVHAIPRGEVLAVLERAGARVLGVVDDASAGPAWTSYRYAATKAR